MSEVVIREVAIPATADAPDAADFVAAIDVANRVQALGYGTPDISYEPGEELVFFHDPHRAQTMLVAEVEGTIVARATHGTLVGVDADAAWLLVQVLPEFRRRGIGTALADAVERRARDGGRVKALSYAPVQDDGGERLFSPTGFGWVSASAPEVRFLLARGYRFEQVERVSRLALPVEHLESRLARARARSGPDYAARSWVGRAPERWHRDLAVLATRMSTDAPTAGLAEPEDVWTVERLIEAEERNERLDTRILITTAVEHLPSARLVGFNELSVPRQRHRCVVQYATLVLREHRGHKLGMLLKVEGLANLARLAPGHPAVITFNAEENRHMLDVNEAVGFLPIAAESAWRKDLD